jgi:hypothetical protein
MLESSISFENPKAKLSRLTPSEAPPQSPRSLISRTDRDFVTECAESRCRGLHSSGIASFRPRAKVRHSGHHDDGEKHAIPGDWD